MNDDIISRKALKKAINDNGCRHSHYFDIFDVIDNAPPIETTIEDLISTLSVEELKATTWFKVDIPSGEAVSFRRDKTGQWIELKTNPPEFLGHRFYICSKCGREIDVMTPDESLDDYPYCHCGACMIKESEKNEHMDL